MPEGADTLGGLRFDQPEPERAFEYAEPPERVMLFGELLEKCGYDEDVVAQYSDVAEVEVLCKSSLLAFGNSKSAVFSLCVHLLGRYVQSKSFQSQWIMQVLYASATCF